MNGKVSELLLGQQKMNPADALHRRRRRRHSGQFSSKVKKTLTLPW